MVVYFQWVSKKTPDLFIIHKRIRNVWMISTNQSLLQHKDPLPLMSLTDMEVVHFLSLTSSTVSPNASPPSLSLTRSGAFLVCVQRCCVGSATSSPCVSSVPPQLKQFKIDNADVGFGSGTMAVDQSIERTVANIKWVEQNNKDVLDWFLNEVNPEHLLL